MKRTTKQIATTAMIMVLFGIPLFVSCAKKETRAVESAAEAKAAEPVKTRKIIVGCGIGASGNSFLDENKVLTGLEVEILKEIDRRLPQYEIEFETAEYASFFAGLRAKRYDLVFGNLRRNDEREDFPHTYRGHNYWANRLIVSKDRSDINGLDDLVGKTVGTSQGTLSAVYMENYIKESGKDIKLVYSSNSVQDVINGRLDTFITADDLVEVSINSRWRSQGYEFKAVGPSIGLDYGVETDHNVYYFFAKGNEDVRSDFSEVIYDIRKEGLLSELMVKFGFEDRSSQIDEAEEEKYMREIGVLK
jgi:L-cystine transport system substrate-binding protein